MQSKKNQQTKPHSPIMQTHDQKNGRLGAIEQQFVTNYIRIGNATEAVRRIEGMENRSASQCANLGRQFLNKPAVKAEIQKIMDELRGESVATADEVMKFFTSVMRGEVKDQFGLDATLSDRTRAAQEIAKRTIDIENRRSGESDQVISIKLDWSK